MSRTTETAYQDEQIALDEAAQRLVNKLDQLIELMRNGLKALKYSPSSHVCDDLTMEGEDHEEPTGASCPGQNTPAFFPVKCCVLPYDIAELGPALLRLSPEAPSDSESESGYEGEDESDDDDSDDSDYTDDDNDYDSLFDDSDDDDDGDSYGSDFSQDTLYTYGESSEAYSIAQSSDAYTEDE